MPCLYVLDYSLAPHQKKACFLTTASPICLRMLMGWQVAHHITILQQLLKHVLALKHSWQLGRRCHGAATAGTEVADTAVERSSDGARSG